jgi:hypothetical protein
MKKSILSAVLPLALAVSRLGHSEGSADALPELAVHGVASPSDTNANLILSATPGVYAILTCSNLTTSWIQKTNVSVGTGGLAEITIPFDGRTPLFICAQGPVSSNEPAYQVRFRTLGSSFEPELTTEGGSAGDVLWTWSDGTTSSSYPIAFKDFSSSGSRDQYLQVRPPSLLTAINLGFDGADGGEGTPLNFRAPQNVAGVFFSQPLTSLRCWGSSYNPISSPLDFRGFTNLQYVECYGCANLSQILVTDLPALKRLCVEECKLHELDLSGNPAFENLRVALNAITNIIVGRGTGPKIWHWCTRDNPDLTQQWQGVMTNFYSLREVLIWNNRQRGNLSFVSTNLTEVMAHQNQFSSATLAGQSNLRRCSVYNNQLTNLDLTGCVALQELQAHGNRLPTPALDDLLTLLDRSAPLLRTVDLSENAGLPSAVGYEHYTNLVNRGVSVVLDWPALNDGLKDVAGGSNAITFVTTSRNPNMEIRTAGAIPTSIRWHWGDGALSVGALRNNHDFGTAVPHTNYVEVLPPECVTYFGAEEGLFDQGITGAFGLTNFPNLSFLYLYSQNLTNLSLVGCGNLQRAHISANPGLIQQAWGLLTNLYSLRVLLISDDNQSGDLSLVSTNLEDLLADHNAFTSIDLAGQRNLWRCSVHSNLLTRLDLTGCTALQELDAHGNRLTTAALDDLLTLLDSSAPLLRTVDLSENAGLPSAVGYAHYTNLVNRNVSVVLDWPVLNDGLKDVVGGSNAITFVTTSRNPNMEIRTVGAVSASIRWHWGDGALSTGALRASHDFGTAVAHTNYVEVLPPEYVIYFGAEQGFLDQGITGAFGLTNFPNLNFLYLYHESLIDLSLAGCSHLRQLHLADNPVSVAICDQWFVDLDQAVPGPVTGADFFYPASRRSSNSDSAWASLVGKGYNMYPK